MKGLDKGKLGEWDIYGMVFLGRKVILEMVRCRK